MSQQTTLDYKIGMNTRSFKANKSADGNPTYGDIIDLFEECENASPGDASYFSSEFKTRYQLFSIERPGRLYDSVLRIVAPTRPSIRSGRATLKGTQLKSYRKRIWIPRTRSKRCVSFPQELTGYGLSEELLVKLFEQVQNEETPLSWYLKGVPNIDFYQALHPYLKKWHVTSNVKKAIIGKFYLTIDRNLHGKTDRTDSAYRFIENISKSKQSPSTQMKYDKKLETCDKKLEEISIEVNELKKRLEESKQQLQLARSTLENVTNEKFALQKQCCIAETKAMKYEKDTTLLKEDCYTLIEENLDMSATLLALRDELNLSSIKDKSTDKNFESPTNLPTSNISEFMTNTSHSNSEFTFQTKQGKRYSPSIRKLYYSLLANQVPASNIANIIKTVVKCFNPCVDVESLVLPQRSCAGYMCRDELKTISNTHKATILSECISKNNGLTMNTDGTTKGQRKIGGLAINDTTISVNELSDGSADKVVADISNELENLRKTAQILKLPNADAINWTMIVSSTSDSASTQKRLNKLIKECKEADEKNFGKATIQTVSLIESFCSMHLGVNLRKAFLSGIVSDSPTDASNEREHHPVDTLVHEFCKLFGRYGTPEYGCGATSFPDFLAIKSSDSNTSEESSKYYQTCASITLDRQVGNRYFVTAANATKIVFLKHAAIEFLKYTGKDKGNKLEKDVYAKLLNPTEIAQLKVDALMFYHVYADLVTLSKSNELKKSVLDMNTHYLELKIFLQEIQQHPEIVLNKDYAVFKTELPTLYGKNEKVNHRYHKNALAVHKKLFEVQDNDTDTLYQLLVPGATKMEEKLCTYAKNQLPGGRYWNLDNPIIKKQLSELKPSNDLCESILGLNDYLTTKIPNLNQRSISNLVEIKKNHSIMWLDTLTYPEQEKIINLAADLRESVQKEFLHHKKEVAKERQKKMIETHMQREAKILKAQMENSKLSQQHLITTSKELHQLMTEINESQIPASKKKAQQLSLLRAQINIRKKVLGQKIHILFTCSRKQRPICDLEKELADFIDQDYSKNSEFAKDPSTLVGRQISHKFKIGEAEYKWYKGTVISYDSITKLHHIEYEEDEEPSYFDLNIDLLNGDLQVFD